MILEVSFLVLELMKGDYEASLLVFPSHRGFYGGHLLAHLISLQ